MAEDTAEKVAVDTEHPEPDKDEMVSPAALAIGVIENYRCTWKKSEGRWEDRPVPGTDKWSEQYFTHLADAHGKTDIRAVKFTHEDGVKARKEAIEKVNAGKLKAPRRNWDEKFGPQGGLPLEELKEKYPEMYKTVARSTPKRRTTENVVDYSSSASTGHRQESVREPISAPEGEEDLERLADEIDGEGAYRSEEEEHAYSAIAPPEVETEESFRYRLIDTTHTFVETKCIISKDEHGDEHTFYQVVHPISLLPLWLEAGIHDIDGTTIEVEVQ